jgi:hypothetical protein
MQFDSRLAGYLQAMTKRRQEVTPPELVYYLLHESDLDMDTAIQTVSDFLARRDAATALMTTLDARRTQLLDAERDALIASLRRLARRQKRRGWLIRLRTVPFFAAVFLIKSPNLLWVFLLLTVITGDYLINFLTGKSRDIAAVKELIQRGGERTVGMLAEALTITEVKYLAAGALIRELPKLKASDAHLLNDEQRGYLYQALEGSDKQLILAILRALEQIGDEKAVPYVERLAEKAGGDRQIRETATACLPYLEARAATQRASRTLLRPSSASAVATPASNTLLRPAQYSSPTEPEQLLRASVGDE